MASSLGKAGVAVERYAREKVVFASTAAELARDASTVPALEQAGAVELLAPLLLDSSPAVQHTAAYALGRMAAASSSVATALVEQHVAATLVTQLAPEPVLVDPDTTPARCLERFGQQRAAIFALRSIIKHNEALAEAVLGGEGALSAVVDCLETGPGDAEVREGAAWCLDCAFAHSASLAERIVAEEPRVLPLLSACLASPSEALTVQRVAASALANACKQGQANGAVAAGTLPALAAALRAPAGSPVATDLKLKRQLCMSVCYIAKASGDLCLAVCSTGLLGDLTTCLSACDDATAKRFAAAALREAAKLGPDTARALADTPGCLGALASAAAGGSLPALLAAGFTASWAPDMADAVIAAGLLPTALACLTDERAEEHVRAAAAWALGQLGRHSAAGAMAVAGTGALKRMVELAAQPTVGEDLRGKCCKALAAVAGALQDVAVLAALLELPLPEPEVMDAVLSRCATVLAANPSARALFVQTGALKRAEELGEAPESPHAATVRDICSLFPEELCNLYSPAYHASLIAKLAVEN